MELLRSAISEGLDVGLPYARYFAREPALDSLRGYPPFQEMIKLKG